MRQRDELFSCLAQTTKIGNDTLRLQPARIMVARVDGSATDIAQVVRTFSISRSAASGRFRARTARLSDIPLRFFPPRKNSLASRRDFDQKLAPSLGMVRARRDPTGAGRPAVHVFRRTKLDRASYALNPPC